jgi:transcriptional regulator with XRE-family HTH domain
VSIEQKLQLLLDKVLDSTGRPYTITHLAHSTGLDQQTLSNLLHGRAANPRLDTMQQICDFFDISLDYFMLPSEAQCLSYLARHGRLGQAPDILQTIEQEVDSLSKGTASNVLAILQWRILGKE